MIARVFTRNKEVRRVSKGPRCFRLIKKSLPDVCHKLSKKKKEINYLSKYFLFCFAFSFIYSFFLKILIIPVWSGRYIII